MKEPFCDVVVELQPINHVRNADAASRAGWQLDSRGARRVISTSADLYGDRQCSGELLAPCFEPPCDALLPTAHLRLRMDWQVNWQQNDESTSWRRLDPRVPHTLRLRVDWDGPNWSDLRVMSRDSDGAA